MFRFILAASLCVAWMATLSSSQNIDNLCRQVYTDCQACVVFQQECRRPSSHPPNRPSKPPSRPEQHPHPTPAPSKPARPTQSPSPTWPPPQSQNTQPAPTWPPPQNSSPAPSWPPSQNQNPNYPESPSTSYPTAPPQPPHNCVQYGRWCKSDEECCTKNCRLELVSMGPEHPDQHFTQSVCR